MSPTSLSAPPEGLRWYGVRAKSHCEEIVSKALTARGYDAFLPCYGVRRRWSDRVKRMELPLFPGYLFCRLDVTERLPVLTSPGVVDLVGFWRNGATASTFYSSQGTSYAGSVGPQNSSVWHADNVPIRNPEGKPAAGRLVFDPYIRMPKEARGRECDAGRHEQEARAVPVGASRPSRMGLKGR